MPADLLSDVLRVYLIILQISKNWTSRQGCLCILVLLPCFAVASWNQALNLKWSQSDNAQERNKPFPCKVTMWRFEGRKESVWSRRKSMAWGPLTTVLRDQEHYRIYGRLKMTLKETHTWWWIIYMMDCQYHRLWKSRSIIQELMEKRESWVWGQPWLYHKTLS